MNFKISARLILGFGTMAAILAVAVGMTIWNVSEIDKTSKRIVELRMPTAAASSDMVKNIYGSLAALRGYMLTGAQGFKNQREEVWANIDKTITNMDELSKSWTNSKNVDNFQVFKGILEEFRIAQQQVEDIAKTPQEQPATLMLVTEAAPRAADMVKNISTMIDLELQGQGGTGGDRVQILGMMADTRGSLGLGLANIRAYLLTGESKFAENFKKLWAKNAKRFGDLSGQIDNLSAEQKAAFDTFAAKREEFSPLPPKMFEIRGSKKWNMANYTLVTEAAPRAGKLLNMLLGNKNAEGVREGGMQQNQQTLLTNDVAKNDSAVSTLLNTEWILLAAGLLAAGVVSFLIIRSIVGPVNGMTVAMGALADGNLHTDIPALDKNDEIGEMAQAVQVFKDNAIRTQEMEAEAKAQKQKTEEEKIRLMMTMADDFENSVGGVVNSVSSASTEMQSSASTLSATAEQTSQQAATVAAASEEASANVQTVASASEELSSSISEISRQVVQSTQIADSAVAEIDGANEKVQGLADAANKIGEVVALITDIADQTNLLALNATIEAARAGEAGKGFAVVASEVKNLANATAKATEEISTQIGDIQGATKDAVEAIGSIGSTINQISEIAGTIAAAVEEQGAATQEIARNVEQAAAGTGEVSSNITGVNQAATETGQSAEQMLGAATELSQQSELLRGEVDKFLANIRNG
ncbi:MAG: methyl-accepting chemotaxis protein [Magnetovibrio sp.]|nr:methyl-accepting chemotaxis protein [Magnetovibrio sp.]